MTVPFGPTLRQPDGYSCGASCVVVARMLRSPTSTPAVRPLASGFAHEVLDTHRRLTGLGDALGRGQLPWPRHLGTPPWAVARALSRIEGRRYGLHLTRHDPEAAYDLARPWVEAGRAGHPVALYVGNRFLPRHVVLALEVADDGSLRCYDPASGTLRPASRWAFEHTELHLGGWTHPWFVVAPS